jgi:hypothetical protein
MNAPREYERRMPKIIIAAQATCIAFLKGFRDPKKRAIETGNIVTRWSAMSLVLPKIPYRGRRRGIPRWSSIQAIIVDCLNTQNDGGDD